MQVDPSSDAELSANILGFIIYALEGYDAYPDRAKETLEIIRMVMERATTYLEHEGPQAALEFMNATYEKLKQEPRRDG